MSAFGALFSTKHSEDGGYPASGSSGGDAAAGGAAVADGKPGDAKTWKLPVSVPPRPCPRARIPVRTRGLRSECGSSVTSSPPGTPSSSTVLSLGAHGNFTSPKTVLSASASAKLEQAQTSPQVPVSCLSWWGGVQPAAAGGPNKPPANPKPVVIKTVPERKAGNTLELSDMCCFRGERGPFRRPCDPIPEDRPETAFDRDVNILELQSLLRHHHIEPNDGLIRDMLQWQFRAIERTPSCVEKRPACSPSQGDFFVRHS